MKRLCVMKDQLHAVDREGNKYIFVFQGDPRNKAESLGGASYNCLGCACGDGSASGCGGRARCHCVPIHRRDGIAGGIWVADAPD